MTALRVAIDVTPLLGAQTGVAVFTRGLVGALANRTDTDVLGFGLTWRGRGDLPGSVPAGVDVCRRPMPANPLRAAWRRLNLPVIERWTGPCDVVHGTNFVVPPAAGAAEVVTVHDLTPVRFPEIVERPSLAFPRLIERALRRGAFVHTPSESVRGEVVDHFGADPARVVAIHHGVAPVGDEDDGGERAGQLVGAAPYILFVGALEPRKDVKSLVRAFDFVAAQDADVRLVLAGPAGWGADEVTAVLSWIEHADRVVRLGYVSDADRSALLRSASVFAYPSRYEGFGFPPLEAMAAGVPVVTTRTGALREVLGDAARFVEPGDVEALGDALHGVLTDDVLRRGLVERGRQQVARYRWDRAADEMVTLYRRAVDAR